MNFKEKYNIVNIESEKVRLNLKNKEETIENVKAQVKAIEDEIKAIEQGQLAIILAIDLQGWKSMPSMWVGASSQNSRDDSRY